MGKKSFKGFRGVVDGRDFRPIKKIDVVNERLNEIKRFNVIEKLCMLIIKNFEEQAMITRKNLNPEKYKTAEIIEKLNKVKEKLEKKQRNLVAKKKELVRITKKSVPSKIKQKEIKILDQEISDLKKEISELRFIKDAVSNDFSYSHYSMKSREDAAYNMDYQKFSNGTPNHGENSEQRISKLECVNKRLKKYISLFNKDEQQDNRRGEQSR